MGKASENRASQLTYVHHRIHMLQEVVGSMDAETVGVEDMEQLLRMMHDLEQKIERFKKDWQEDRG
ncbi:SE1561 family protein [Pontibacillus litoralis]|uniref:Uncharacterized protein n=1 Tax=Pontibacillus litoralis JSM 072002 TaxID=1385512 RepID=A0A0A5HU61_9BACI|nr:SE1561 family protein [Pontibacillus litoralis]KGX87187.1 hypothetical protein N784_16200 [Pontibacillus litoralis JSM 072002]